MLKEELLIALKAKFQGVSDKILDRIAVNLAKTVTKQEDVQTAVDGVTLQQLLDSYGDSRATDATKTAVLNYEKKHSIKDGKPVVEPERKPQETAQLPEDTPDWAKTLMDSVKALSNTVSVMQGAELTKSRKQKLSDAIAPLSEVMRKGYERINLKDLKDDEFETLLSEIQGEVGEITKAEGARGAVFGKPTVAGANLQAAPKQEATKEEVDAVMSHLKL